MSTPNPNQLSPAFMAPERGRQEFQEVIAVNGRREGPRQAAEGLGQEPGYRNAFGQGVVGSRASRGDWSERPRQVFKTQIAPNARGRLASGQEIPAWSGADPAMRAAFAQGDNILEYQASVRPV